MTLTIEQFTGLFGSQKKTSSPSYKAKQVLWITAKLKFTKHSNSTIKLSSKNSMESTESTSWLLITCFSSSWITTTTIALDFIASTHPNSAHTQLPHWWRGSCQGCGGKLLTCVPYGGYGWHQGCLLIGEGCFPGKKKQRGLGDPPKPKPLPSNNIGPFKLFLDWYLEPMSPGKRVSKQSFVCSEEYLRFATREKNHGFSKPENQREII